MSDFYEQLEQYFATTPREKILEDWAKTEEYDKIGPTAEALLNNILRYQVHSFESLTETFSKTPNTFNPKFSSGFLFSRHNLNYAESSLFY